MADAWGAIVGVGGGKGESAAPLVLPPAVVVLRVRNQQFIGVGLPFITTGPRYSKLNDSSWLISSQSNLQIAIKKSNENDDDEEKEGEYEKYVK